MCCKLSRASRRRRRGRRPRRAPAGQVRTTRAPNASGRPSSSGCTRAPSRRSPTRCLLPRPARVPSPDRTPAGGPARLLAPRKLLARPLARPPHLIPHCPPLREGAPPRGGEGARGEAEGAEEGAEGRRQFTLASSRPSRAGLAAPRRLRGLPSLRRPARPVLTPKAEVLRARTSMKHPPDKLYGARGQPRPVRCRTRRWRRSR